MKVFDIFFEWIKGLWTAGGILSRFVAILCVLVGMVLLIIAIILNFGIKLFKIFWDETLFYSSKGYSFFKQILNTFNLVLQFLIYYLLKLLTVLIPSRKIGVKKPKLEITFLLSIIKDTFLAFFFYSISIIIFIISLYWLLTYVELLIHVGQWILSLFNSSYSILNAIKEVFNSLENWSLKVFSVNLFSITLIWLIRIIGFCSIFLVRFLRLKKNNASLEVSSIIPYKKPFWDNQVEIKSNYRVIYSIALSVIVVLLIGGVFFFSKDDNPQLDYNEVIEKNNVDSIQTTDTSSVKMTRKNGEPVNEEMVIMTLNNLMNNALINLKAQEYDESIKQLDEVLKRHQLPKKIEDQISEIKIFIKAREDNEAMKLLNELVPLDKQLYLIKLESEQKK